MNRVVAALACTPFVLIVLDTGLAAAHGWRPVLRMEYLAVAVLAGAAFGCALPVVLRRSAAARNAGLTSAVILLGAGALETVLHVAPIPGSEALYHLRVPGSTTVLHPAPGVLSGVTGAARISINHVGLRGPELSEAPDVTRILCVGGSATECLYLDDQETWPELLLHKLHDVWVGSAGLSGATTEHHLRFLRESDLVPRMDYVLLLVGVNDFVEDVLRPDVPARSVARVPLWRRSRTFGRVRALVLSHSVLVEDAAALHYQERRRLRLSAPKTSTLPDLRGALADYEERVRLIAETVRRRGAQPVFVTQPVLWRTGLPAEAENRLWFGARTDGTYASTEALRLGMDAYNAALQSACRRLGVPCLDLSSMNGNGAWFYDDCHFNEAGAREAARLLEAQWQGPSISAWSPAPPNERRADPPPAARSPAPRGGAGASSRR